MLARPKPRVVVHLHRQRARRARAAAGSGQIWDSNSFLITAAAREAGATAFRVGIVPDEPRQLLDAIEDQLIRADLVITTGGVSVGAYDVVKEVLSRLGTVEFDKVAMQPGMPQGRGIDRAGRDADLHPARQPGERLRLLRGLRPAGAPPAARARRPLPSRGAGRVASTASASPAGKRQFARGVLGGRGGPLRRHAR